MPGTFRDICDEFNRSAEAISQSVNSPEMLLIRFELLLKHKAEADEEKRELVETLYKCGKTMLMSYSGPEGKTWIPDYAVSHVQTIFTALCAPESIKHIPETAPRELADVALDLLDRADTSTQTSFHSYTAYADCIKGLTSLSRIALKAANAARVEIDQHEVDIKTGKTITPAKRLVLKQSGGTP